MAYKHVQWGWTWLLYLIFSTVMTVVVIVGVGESEDDEAVWVTVATVVFLVVLFFVVLAFSRLEVTVDAENVTAAFGYGSPKKVVAHIDVVAVREVRNNWWQGLGVRNISNGWMYNIWGLDAVELELADGKVFRIGTNDSERLTAALILR